MEFGHDDAANIALAVLQFRRERLTEFDKALFNEPAWDFLLELFMADAKGERMTGRQIAATNNISPVAASRWLKYLNSLNLARGDGDGDLDDLLTLDPGAIGSMERLLSKARVLWDSLPAAHKLPVASSGTSDPSSA